MRKLLVTALSLTLLAGVIAPTVSAQHNSYGRSYPNYGSTSNYRRNNTLKKVGIGAVAGALIGGLIGGKKGAVVGGIAGAGGGYVWSRNNGRYNRPYYNSQQPSYRPQQSYYGNQQPYYGNPQPYYSNRQPYYNNYPSRRH